MEIKNPYTLFQIGELVHVEWTALIYVFILFALTAYCMNTLLFKPVLRYIGSFDKKEKEFHDKANQFRQELKRRTTEFEDKKKQYFEELRQEKEQILKETKIQALEVVNKTRTETKSHIIQNEEDLLKGITGLKDTFDASIGSDDKESLIPTLKNMIISKLA